MELTVQDNSIFVQKFNANGTISGDMVRLEAISKTDGSDHYPQITAVGTAGEYVVTFYGREREGGHSIFVQKFNANGTISGDMVQLEALGNTTSNDHAPQITAVGTAGEYVVTFTGADSAGDDSIFVQKFNANGTISGDMVPLEAISKTDGDDGISQITAVGTAGEYVVTFTGEDGAGDESIFVQKFNANGTISGSMVRLEALGRTIGDDFSPQITAVGTAGEYVVTFSGYDSAGDYSIFVQKFNADGTVASANSPLAVDTVAPTVAITSDVETLKANETATITFTFSEVPTGFVQADDVVVTGGTLGAITFDSTGKIGTATYTPTADTASATASITIASSLFTDAAGNAAGNAGGAGTTPTIAIDTLAPTVAIASSSSTRDTTPIIEGNAEAGATVTVVVSGATYEVIATQNGIWSLNLESATPKSGALTPLQVGQNYTVTVNAIDVAGNSAEGQTQTLNVVANQIPYIRNLDWIDTDGQNGSDTPVMYIAKGQEVNINLQNYIKDSDGDDVTVTVNSSTLPAGFSINNGIITGTTTADSGNINVTLSDGNGGIKTQTIALQSIVIPDNFAKTYSQTTPQIDPIDPTTTFFGVSSGGKDIWQAIINKTEVSQQEYNYNGSLFVVDSEDQETFIVSNVIDNGVIISVGGTTESIVLSEAKEVTSINGIDTAGLKQVTATFTVLTSTPIESTSTDNWFVIPDDELHQSVSLSMLTELKNMLLDSNYDRYIYINSDTKVRLVGDQSATSGTLVEMVQDGTYNYWTTDENLVTGNTIENGIWKIETINAVEYLTVNVPNEGIIAFKVDSGNLMITKVGGVGSTDSETFYYGVDFNTFGSIVANVYLNTPKFISSGGFPINISTIEEIPNATVVYDADAFVYDTADVGIAYSISGTDSSLFSISSTTGEVKFKESPDFETKKDNGENNIYDFTVTATADGKSADQAVSITVTDLSYESLAGGGNGTTAIDLGAGYGQLINGVRVEGKWYYYWDRSGDGTSAGADYTTHNILDGIFNNDINGVTNTTVANADGLYGTTDTYRYATINEVRVALPTANGGVAYPRGINHYQNGTAYSDPTEGGASDTTTSTPFNELLAIWDAFNGTGTSGYCDGTPSSGWDASTYWSATTSDSGHAYVNLYDGIVYRYGDTNDLRVALQVL